MRVRCSILYGIFYPHPPHLHLKLNASRSGASVGTLSQIRKKVLG
jgi:hypothetical protein